MSSALVEDRYGDYPSTGPDSKIVKVGSEMESTSPEETIHACDARPSSMEALLMQYRVSESDIRLIRVAPLSSEWHHYHLES